MTLVSYAFPWVMPKGGGTIPNYGSDSAGGMSCTPYFVNATTLGLYCTQKALTSEDMKLSSLEQTCKNSL